MSKTVILLPTYNERENIAYLVPEIFKAHPELYVLVIDDSSPDGTAQEVETLMKKYPHLSLLSRPGKQGLGEAYKAGIRKVLEDAEIERVFTMDADGSHGVEYLSAMIKAGKTHDLVVGSRYVAGGGIENWEKWRYAISFFGNLYAHTVSLLPLHDLTAGFMNLSANKLRQIDFSEVHAAGYEFMMELKYIFSAELSASVTEVPIVFKARREGESKMPVGRYMLKGLKAPWRLFFRRVGKLFGKKNVITLRDTACVVCASDRAREYAVVGGYPIVECTRCHLMFVHPLPDTNAVYGEDYFAGAEGGHGYVNYDADKEVMVPTMEEYVRRLYKYVPGGGTLLDVGTATGFFLSIAKRMGWNVEGVEIADYAASLGREKGLAVHTGTLADVPGKERFEAITMLDVIEHVSDPRADIEKVHALLKPGGVVFINTPDAGSLYAKLMGKRWHLMVPPEHVYYFNRENISQLLEECGFEVLEKTTIGKSFTLPYIFKTLYAWQKLSMWHAFECMTERGVLSRIGIPINLYDNMVVIARKR